MIRRPPRSTLSSSSAASDVYKRQVYEPSFEQLRDMLSTLRQEQPVPTLAVQFSGGEPTLREDLPEIIKMAVEMGFIQTQIATNGIRLGKDDTLAQKLRQAGLNTVYLQFNGVSKETDLSLIHISEPTRLLSISYAVF